MTTGEDEAQAIVGKMHGDLAYKIVGRSLILYFVRQRILFAAPCFLATALVDESAMGSPREPGRGLFREAALRPRNQRRRKGFLHRFLGFVERTADPDEGGED